MAEQLDIFSAGAPAAMPGPPPAQRNRITPADLDDETLIASLATPTMAECLALIAEAGRRRLATCVPALTKVCSRFKGYGGSRPHPEQVAVLTALAAIGGREAARAVADAIVRAEVRGATIKAAVAAAARLGAALPADTVLDLLRHGDPDVRADACRCARAGAGVAAVLDDLLGDLHVAVRAAAACALGRMGRAEARPVLVAMLADDPSVEVIGALAALDNDDTIVLMGRVAHARPDLAGAVLDALDGSEHPHAAKVARGIRAQRGEAPSP